LIVEPVATIPVAEWLGSLGVKLGLPPVMDVETYLVADAQYVETDDSMVIAAGPGISAGPLVLEWQYRVVSGGGTQLGDTIELSSGGVLWVGGRFEF
jgi:hypothetical protein